jgi:2-iminobutanoate/2-iminopropanoate deaminase
MMSELRKVESKNAPAAIGPYSQAISLGNLVFCSGQIPLNPTNGEMVGANDISAQTHQVMKNLEAVLGAAGSGFDRVVKTTIYLKDLGHFGQVNEIYGSYFKAPFPARVTIQAAKLPKDAWVEIDAIAKV